MKRVGIVCSKREMFKRPHHALNQSFVRLFEAADVLPVLLPVAKGMEEEYLSRVDALILVGGSNIASFHYGQNPHKTSMGYDLVRDAFELAIAKRAIEKEIPIMGICRGMQIINIALGGTLKQFIEDKGIVHSTEDMKKKVPFMFADIKEGFFYDIFGERTIINSFHKQKVDKLGEGLRATIFAPDGVIKGIESDDRRIIGMQFHPEFDDHNDKFKDIFTAFVQII